MSGEWELDPGVLLGAGVALVLFAQGFGRLRRRRSVGWDRAAWFAGGVAVALLALVSPLHEWTETSLSAHMLQHVLVGDVAPAMLVVALRGPLTFFLLPAPALRRLARLRALRRALAWLLRPAVSFSVWALSLALWHVPAVYDYALTHPLAHHLQHASFMTGGLLIWAQLVDPARRRALTRAGRLAFAGCVFAAGLVLADVLVFAPVLYPAYASHSDQQVAGLVMLLEQSFALGACAWFLLPSSLYGTAVEVVGRFQPRTRRYGDSPPRSAVS